MLSLSAVDSQPVYTALQAQWVAVVILACCFTVLLANAPFYTKNPVLQLIKDVRSPEV